ncbi:MAG TPA: hypothetical protein V6C57_13705, partial [Coleofasciculaceae cyanobacterium]
VELRRRLRQKLGLDELIQQIKGGWEWTKHNLAGYAATARALAPQIKVALNFTITDKVSDVQIVHQLLLQLGIKVRFCCWSRSVQGQEGEKLRVYRLDAEHWQVMSEILERRRIKQEALHSSFTAGTDPKTDSGSPWGVATLDQEGDPKLQFSDNGLGAGDWLTVEAVKEVRQMWLASQTLEEQEWMRANIPAEVLKRAIA